MIKKQQQFIPKGMNQDIAQTKVQSELAHSIKNLRVVTDETDGTLSLVTEKGTVYKQAANTIRYNTISPGTISISYITSWSYGTGNNYPQITLNNDINLCYRTKVTVVKIKYEHDIAITRSSLNYTGNSFPRYIDLTIDGINKFSNNINCSGHGRLEFNKNNFTFTVRNSDETIIDYISMYAGGPVDASSLNLNQLKFSANNKIAYINIPIFEIEWCLNSTPPELENITETIEEQTVLKENILNSILPIFKEYKNWKVSENIQIKKILGTCVVNNYLICFGKTANRDIIVKYNFSSNPAGFQVLYSGDLNFNEEHPIQTYLSYESENQQRVYWIDGLNEPRVINVADNITYETIDLDTDNHFNFCTPIYLYEDINITKKATGGNFHSGVIQYFMTYVDQNQQESKIFYQSPLYYLTNSNRALSPEETSQNCFVLNIKNTNANDLLRDKLRIYSLQRTSLDATPVAKLVTELKLERKTSDIIFIDTGNIGMNIDPQIILMAGCDYFIPQSMSIKDNTMFFGNIKLENYGSINKINNLNLNFECERASDDNINILTNGTPNKMYVSYIEGGNANNNKSISKKGAKFNNDFQLNGFKKIIASRNYKQNENGSDNEIKTFMYQEEYMLGIQLLHKTGEWSQPIWVGDYIMSEHAKVSDLIELPIFECFYTTNYANDLLNNGYIAIRPLAVYNKASEGRVICQGVINPVIYDKENGLESNDTYSNVYESSWFFRPKRKNSDKYFGHNDFAGSEITYNEFDKYGFAYLTQSGDILNEVQNNDNRFKISTKVVSFNSPEIEFEKITTLPKDIKVNKIGIVQIHNVRYDLNITTSTTPKNLDQGFDKNVLRTKHMNYSFENGKIGTWMSFIGGFAWKDCDFKWYVYPWENDQSYSCSPKDEEDVLYGCPDKKTITNWRYSQYNIYFNNVEDVNLNFAKIINSNCCSIESFIYEKDVDILLFGNYSYSNYNCCKLKPQITKISNITYSKTVPSGNVDWSSHINSLEGDLPEGIGDNYNEVYDQETQEYYYQWYEIRSTTTTTYLPIIEYGKNDDILNSSVRIQYKSTPHAILGINNFSVNENSFTNEYGYLPLVSLINTNYDSNILAHFKGRYYNSTTQKYEPTKTSLTESVWYIAGDIIKLNPNKQISVKWEKGDTYYQKYHCLKTYPYTHESPNNIVDILSFLIYTRINLNGCYDDKYRNDILHIDNNNFNKLNDVYTQEDNFFTYRVIDEENLNDIFPNLITWSKSKMFGESIDSWTNIHLVNTLDLDGSLGKITSLNLWNNKLLAFQEKGIAVLRYNENTMIQSTNNVNIELASSNLVTGKEYLSNQFGCQNKWSIVNAKTGLYFSDDYNHKLYVLSDGIKCISDNLGFRSYLKTKNYENTWKINGSSGSALRTFYNQKLGEIYFTDGMDCLTFNENLNLFSSFYDYTDVYYSFTLGTNNNPKELGVYELDTVHNKYVLTNDTNGIINKYYYRFDERIIDFVNIENKNYWITNSYFSNRPYFYENRANNYLNIFGVNREYSIELTSNLDPHLDKIFDTVEIRGDAYIGDNLQSGYNIVEGVNTTSLPFDKLQVSNEYQDTGEQELKFIKDKPYSSASNMKQKFRIWRAAIGRNKKNNQNTRDRIRNYWSRIKLVKNATNNLKAKIHDIVVDVYE